MCHRDKSGALVYLSYSGVVDITPELGLILGGSPDAKTTAFGNSCRPRALASPFCQMHPYVYCLLPSFHFQPNSMIANLVIEMKFETGDEKLKGLETGVFLGAGRFVVEQGKPVVVEYKISKAVKGG